MKKNFLDVADFYLYDFTNEVLKEYFPYLNVENKRVLTVVGSGDQALNLIFLGASEVDTFDINPKAKEYMLLKACAILELNYQEFIKYMVSKDKSIIDYENFYKRIRDYLPEETKNYWDFHYQNKSEIYQRTDFSQFHFANNFYATEEGYHKLQKKLNLSKIHFISSNLMNLHLNLEKSSKYQAIICSNISTYLPFSDQVLCSHLKKNLFPFLELSGIIQYAYYYSSGIPIYLICPNRKLIQFVPVHSFLEGDSDCACFLKKLK